MSKRFKVRVKAILQQSETECGVAALAMLFNYYKLNIAIEELREKCGASRDGCKATTLLEVARDFGFQADGYKVELENLTTLGQPVIAFWNFNHYIVITGVDSKNVYLNDPAQGKLSITHEEFDKAFTGIVLTLKPTANLKKIKPYSILANYFLEWFWEFRIEWLFILMMSLIYMCVPLVNSMISSIFINFCVIGTNTNWLPWIGLATTGLAFFMVIIVKAQQTYQFKISAKASLVKSTELILHTLKLPLLYFSLRQKSEIITILTRSEMVLDSFFKNMTSFAISIFMAICCLSVMVMINNSLTIKLLGLITLFSVVPISLAQTSFNFEKKLISSENKLYAFTMANLRNFDTIKACALEYDVLNKWYELFNKNLQNRSAINTLTSKISSFNTLAIALSLLAMLCWGSSALIQESLSLGNLIAYYALLMLFCKNMQTMFQAYKDGQKAFVSHVKINDLKKYPEDKRFQLTEKSYSFNEEQPLIKCSNLNFYFNKHVAPTLKNIELEIKLGQQIAFVGATGSGKSTLAKLLCGLYAFEHGDIQLSGHSIAEFSAEDFFKYYSYVSQEISLFTGSIYENLTLGLSDVSLTKIATAIQNAGLQELINQRGLHSRVDENGDNFSGGEKQRMEIARALLHDAPILVLDEATSALDVATEAKIIANLRALNKTIIYVAHRLSTIQHCDTIYILNQGSIVEHGNHESLLIDKKHYFHLINQENSNSEC
jgi:ATP-binding cassette subfamily C protein